jgi:hypothetical protein
VIDLPLASNDVRARPSGRDEIVVPDDLPIRSHGTRPGEAAETRRCRWSLPARGGQPSGELNSQARNISTRSLIDRWVPEVRTADAADPPSPSGAVLGGAHT